MGSRDDDFVSPGFFGERWGPERAVKKTRVRKEATKHPHEINYNVDPGEVYPDTIKPYQITEFRLSEYKEMFSMFDTSGNGTIDVQELGNMLKALGHHVTEEEIKDILENNDQDESHDLTFPEFLSVMADLQPEQNDEELSEAFQMMDTENRGDIGERELRGVMEKLGTTLTDAEIKDMIREADSTGNGRISFQEFVTMMNKSP